MERRKRYFAALVLVVSAIAWHYMSEPWGYYWKVPEEEAALRQSLIAAAEGYLGANEDDGSHQAIIDRYNAHEALALGYEVQYTDSWCSAFVSTCAIEADLTEIIPTECGCQRHIELFRELGCWVEDDWATPLPGDLIFFDWDRKLPGESDGWSDHVGIVVGTKWPFVKVIEGNRGDAVAYHILLLGDISIRGYAKPDYAAMAAKTP